MPNFDPAPSKSWSDDLNNAILAARAILKDGQDSVAAYEAVSKVADLAVRNGVIVLPSHCSGERMQAARRLIDAPAGENISLADESF